MVVRAKTILICILLLPALCAMGNNKKQPLKVESLVDWQRITSSLLSDDGKLAAVKHEPWKGDGTVLLYDGNGQEIHRLSPAGNFKFSPSSRFLIVEEKAPLDTIEKLKLRKTKPDDMPMDKLALLTKDGKREVIDSVRNYKIADGTDWLAYQSGNKKDSTLHIRSLDGATRDSIPAVSDYGFAEKGTVLYYVTKGDTLSVKAGIYLYRTDKGAKEPVKEGSGDFKKAGLSKSGEKLAFLYADKKDSTDTKAKYALYLSTQGAGAGLIAEQGSEGIPDEWIVSPQGNPAFSENEDYLFFPTSPEPRERDTTVLAENRPDVQVWNWNEAVQYTQQTVETKKQPNKTYTAAYHIPSGKITQLNTPEIPNLQLPEAGDLALVITTEPYATERMWRGRSRSDIYIIDMKSGETCALISGSDARIRISPAGKYGYWYSEADSSWYTCPLATKEIYRLTTPATFDAWDSENDVPDHPSAYGSAGWTKDDRFLLLYDRYDIWRFDPEAQDTPVNLTMNGRQEGIRYRLRMLDRDVKYIDPGQQQFLTGFNEKTKSTRFFGAMLAKQAKPAVLLTGDFKASLTAKAKNADAVIYTKETFSQYPEMNYSDLRFRKTVQLTNLGSQQDSIIWGTAELTSWISLDGKKLEGVVYKPADFDPNKKYPLLVNFYERNSESLYNYKMPEPHRSTIDYRLYNSNGYIIFNPDVRYEDGYPGESCFNSVMPGIASLIGQGFIDEKAIGAQGHSWGGYQVAYLATRTDLFAAIESGAPVVNMFSAYGGIRWETGLNRSFQYEHGQSRIGATPWETPLRYQENSPLFTMDKVTTPILIMHNDADGHVPWYQGIEYFISLKRLQKPVWLLNYTGEPHWPMKMPNRIDFQKRMFQFFEHYLKGAPMPQWMQEGVKAEDKPFELGY